MKSPSLSQENGNRLAEALRHAAELLPAQGPLTVFVHHNTLHAFEDMPFEDAVKQAGAIFGASPYLSEKQFREFLGQGRIRREDVEQALRDDLTADAARALLGGLVSRLDLRLVLMRHAVVEKQGPALDWALSETGSLDRLREDLPQPVRTSLLEQTLHWISEARHHVPAAQRGAHTSWPPADDILGDLRDTNLPLGWDLLLHEHLETVAVRALWQACLEAAERAPRPMSAPGRFLRHRDALLAVTGQDTDELVHPLLIRLCAAFLDQGVAYWSMPDREKGFFHAFCRLYSLKGGPPETWLRGLDEELKRFLRDGVQAGEAARESLRQLGVTDREWESFIRETLLALRGWAGMMHQVERRPDRVPVHAPPASLMDFLAVRLLLERCAVRFVAREAFGPEVSLAEVREYAESRIATPQPPAREERAWLLFQISQILGWSAGVVKGLPADALYDILADVEKFSSLERRRIFQQAYERAFYDSILNALAAHRPHPRRMRSRFQAVFCIDEREESIRRHLEAVAPRCETFGTAGFFGLPIYYQGAADPHPRPLCPIAISPTHLLEESVEEPWEEVAARRERWRRMLGEALRGTDVGSRTLVRGALLTSAVGVVAAVPLVLRVLFPRWTARLRDAAGTWVRPPARTRLRLRRSALDDGLDPKPGFNTMEMADIVQRLLEEIGLTERLARVVFIVGHGSSSLNNPHEAAHDCGACGGGRGGPNARAFAQMANDPEVRTLLQVRGLHLPAGTVFIGAYHNTCDDSIRYYDTDPLSPAAARAWRVARRSFARALARNAHERARRFDSAPLTLSSGAALRHMEARTEDLAQTRPEYGHATNAVCLVGRRERTRGLFLDRRPFLVSYDSSRDGDDGAVLARILRAVVPVCAGINLEYYFSFVAPVIYGCGTKLPHNITGLLGVMDGHASDLRTGLPWQMVEIHEPVRLLVVVETRPDRLQRVLDREEQVHRLAKNRWFTLYAQDPETGALSRWTAGNFTPFSKPVPPLPVAPTSASWYAMQRGHLAPAVLAGTK